MSTEMMFTRRRLAARGLVATAIVISVGLPFSRAEAGVPPAGRFCAVVPIGAPGDLAIVNLTPVGATLPGNGQLISSDIQTPPNASNVNFAPGTVDPNVAVAPIGRDRTVCFVPTVAEVDIVIDLLATLAAGSFTPTPTGAPVRLVDTRIGAGGARLAANNRRCFPSGATPGSLAVVNLTPVGAVRPGFGALTSSIETARPGDQQRQLRTGDGRPQPRRRPRRTRRCALLLQQRARAGRPGRRPPRHAAGRHLRPPGRWSTPATARHPSEPDTGPAVRGSLLPHGRSGRHVRRDQPHTARHLRPGQRLVEQSERGDLIGCQQRQLRAVASVDVVADLLATIAPTAVVPTDLRLPRRLADSRSSWSGPVVCATGTRCVRADPNLSLSIDGGATWALTTVAVPWPLVVDEIGCRSAGICIASGHDRSFFRAFLSDRHAWITLDGGARWMRAGALGAIDDVECVGVHSRHASPSATPASGTALSGARRSPRIAGAHGTTYRCRTPRPGTRRSGCRAWGRTGARASACALTASSGPARS